MKITCIFCQLMNSSNVYSEPTAAIDFFRRRKCLEGVFQSCLISKLLDMQQSGYFLRKRYAKSFVGALLQLKTRNTLQISMLVLVLFFFTKDHYILSVGSVS